MSTTTSSTPPAPADDESCAAAERPDEFPTPPSDVMQTAEETLAPQRPSWLRRRLVSALATLALLAYVLPILVIRFRPAFRPWVIEGDSTQTTWQFYRYFDEGTLPLGQLMTDYAWIYNAPLLYRAVMIPCAMFFDPVVVGHVLSLVLYCITLAAMYWVGRAQVNHYCGLAAVALLIRTPAWHAANAGGHARAFGAPLLLLFVGAWVTGRRRLCLVLLVLMAAAYPPVAMACSLAFGTWHLWRFFRDREWRPFIELAITGVLVLVCAKSQDLSAPEWWGSPVSYSDVLHHPAFQRGSRMEFVPHEPVASACWRYLTQLYHHVGHELIDGLPAWNRRNGFILVLGPAVAVVAAALALRVRLPGRILWLIVCGFLAYMLARTMAFQFHVPTRPIRETWGVAIPAFLAVTTFVVAYKAWPSRRRLATVVATLMLLAPPLLVSQDGIGTRSVYSSHARDAALWQWVRSATPKDAIFAGSYRAMDHVGLLGWRVPYVNWAQAHPFRAGYWQEIERRTLRMYEAYWAVNVDTVLEFAEEEGIDYMIVDMRNKNLYRTGKQKQEPFPPLVKPTKAMFDACRKSRCLLFEDIVKPAVVKSHLNWRVIDLKKLRETRDGIPAHVPARR